LANKQVGQLQAMFEPVVISLGFDLWGIEYISQGRHSTLRVYIDSENGINVDDCATVSRQVSAILDVEDPIAGEYSLEVSSPGMDRPLFCIEHYSAYQGEAMQLRLLGAISGRRKFTGVLESVAENILTFIVDGELLEVPFDQIEKGRIVLDFKS